MLTCNQRTFNVSHVEIGSQFLRQMSLYSHLLVVSVPAVVEGGHGVARLLYTTAHPSRRTSLNGKNFLKRILIIVVKFIIEKSAVSPVAGVLDDQLSGVAVQARQFYIAGTVSILCSLSGRYGYPAERA